MSSQDQVPTSIQSLTSLRWVCALYVFLFHTQMRVPLLSTPYDGLLCNGYTGMTFFFILSGFVLTIRYSYCHIAYSDFVVARIARIYPAFFVAFVLTFASWEILIGFDHPA